VSDHDDFRDLELLARDLKQRIEQRTAPARWNAEPEDVRRSVMQLVLTLIEFIRQLLERQALRRVDNGTLTPEQTERVGATLMQLEETVHDLARQAGIDPKDLNLDFGPLGKLS
jgi:Gas vesicle protein K